MKRQAIDKIRFDKLTFAFEGAEPVFNEVSFEWPSAGAVWVRSPGGRGKSTLLKLMMGTLTPQSGSMLMNEQRVEQMSFEDFLPYRLNMGYGFDMGGLLNNRSIRENLLLPLQYHKSLDNEEIESWVDEVLAFFGLGHSRDMRPFAVSGSVRKLTCVVRAFIHRPQMVLLDDPLTGLKDDHVQDLIHFVEQGFAHRGLKQIVFTGESPVLADRFKAHEVLISSNWFTERSVAA